MRIRLSDLVINGVKVHRELVPTEYRAYCPTCGWGGPWRSIWQTWDLLVSEITHDYASHNAEAHGKSYGATLSSLFPENLVQS